MEDDQNNKTASLLDINKARRKKKDPEETKEKKESKPSAGLIYHDIATAINHDKTLQEVGLPPFQSRYVVFKREKSGNEIVYIDENNIAIRAEIEDVAADIMKYVKKHLFSKKAFQFTAKHALECAKSWELSAYPCEQPKAFLWKNEPGITFNRLPWDYYESIGKPYPMWEELLSRIKINKSAFCEFIASIFFEDSYNQQYLWLNGQGGDGKGTILNVLQRIFGQLFYAGICPGERVEKEKFLWPMYGCRVISFDDIKSTHLKLPTYDWFMSLTGGMEISIRAHYKKPVSVRFNSKIICTANGEPQISSERSDLRRLVYGEL
jgi:hypothetical protein